MRTFSICLIFLLGLYSEIWAQRFVEEYWHKGKVYLESGDTLVGDIKFSLENEVLQIGVGGTLLTLTARKILSFEFYDAYEQRDRHYYVLPFAKVTSYKTPAFLELLLQGEPITLLCREQLVTRTTMATNPYYVNMPSIPVSQRYVKTNFYFLNKNGKIKPYDGTKKDLLILLQDREKDIKDYIKNNRVRFDSKQDIASLIEYYNAEKKKSSQ